jgi:hypothetical protein
MIQAVSETSGFIATEYIAFLIGNSQSFFQTVDKLNYQSIVRFDLDLGKNTLFCPENRFGYAQSVICGMDIHTNFKYSIHEVTSFACGKPRIWLIFAFVSIRVNPRCCKRGVTSYYLNDTLSLDVETHENFANAKKYLNEREDL